MTEWIALRTVDTLHWTPEEWAIDHAISAVERLVAHLLLTNSVIYHIDAQTALADWVDGAPFTTDGS